MAIALPALGPIPGNREKRRGILVEVNRWLKKLLARPALAIAQNTLTSGSTNNVSSYTTASVTLTANRLVLLAQAHIEEGGGTTAAGVPTSTGATWVQVASTVNGRRLQVFRTMVGSNQTGTITGATLIYDSVVWSVMEFSGVDTTGTNGSGALSESNTATGTSTSPSVSLVGIAANNATYGAVTKSASAAFFTPGSGYTEVHDQGQGGDFEVATGLATEYRLDGQTTVDGTITSAAWAIIGIEIQASAAGGDGTDMPWAPTDAPVQTPIPVISY